VDDVEAIKQLKARYFRCLDTKDWDGYRAVFTDDVLIDCSGSGGGVYRGVEEFMAYVLSYVAPLKTVHHGHMPEITIQSDTRATGIWSMEDWVGLPDGRELNAQGHYFETYAKVGGEWRIKEMALTRLRMHIDGKTEWMTTSAERARTLG
jgi:hypothetical protein